mgnify:CR=1 FL=1
MRNAHVQLQLIDDLAGRVAHHQRQDAALDIRPVDIQRVLESALDAVRPAAVAKGLTLQSLLDPGAGPINGDPDRLQQVVWNLLMNAVKFTPRDGRIQLTLQRVNSQVEIVVSDTGAGIRHESAAGHLRPVQAGREREHAQPGWSRYRARARSPPGRAARGSVTAESAGEGKGSTFRVKLPLVAALSRNEGRPGAPHGPATDAGVSRPFARGLRVLVVDDDPDALDLIATILRRAEAEAVLCSSPPEALAALRSWKPHVLVSDIEMPGE